MAEEELTKRTVSALKWTYGAALAGLVPQLIYTTVIARVLEPTAFGLIALAQVFLRFGGYFAQLGVGAAIVQKETITDRDLRAAFTSTVGLGLLVAGIVAAAAPTAIDLFGSTDVVPVIRVLGLTFVVDGIGRTGVNVLRRELRFSTLAMIELPSYAIGYLVVGLGSAFLGAGVWSLVAASMSQAALVSIGAIWATRHPMRPTFAVAEFKVLYGFGGRVSIIGFLQFLASTLDVIFIGRYRSEAELGQYNRGSYLVVIPFTQLVTNLSKVLFPAFSRIQDDIDRLRGAYLSAFVLLSAILVPTAVGMAVASDQLVRVVLGEGWEFAAAVVPALALVQAVGFLTHLGGLAAEAVARLNEKILIEVVTLVLGVAMFVLLASRDASVVAYAWGALFVAVVKHLGYIVLIRRILTVPWGRLGAAYGRAVAAGGVVAAAILGMTALLNGASAPVALVLLGQVVAGALGLAVSATHGPLRPARRELRDRVAVSSAFGSGRAGELADRLLAFGDRPSSP